MNNDKHQHPTHCLTEIGQATRRATFVANSKGCYTQKTITEAESYCAMHKNPLSRCMFVPTKPEEWQDGPPIQPKALES